MEMISEAIVGVLRGGRRAVIPGLGAFLRKEGDEKVVFVEFLKKDDGVLAGLLGEQYGLSAREVQEAVGGFVGDLQRMVNTSGGFVIEGLGTMRIDANGVLDLDYDPAAKAATPIVEPEDPFVDQEVFETPEEFEIVATGQSDSPQVVDFEVDTPIEETPRTDPMVVEFEPLGPEPRPAARPVSQPVFEQAAGVSGQDRDTVRQTIYHRPPRHAGDSGGRKRTDSIMIVAIAAAAVAILAMIYGRVAERRSRHLPETPPTEQTATDTLEAAGNI